MVLEILRLLLSARAGQAAVSFTLIAGTLVLLLLAREVPLWLVGFDGTIVGFVFRGVLEDMIRARDSE